MGWNPGWTNDITTSLSGLAAHFAIRIRFGMYYFRNDQPNHYYPMSYSIDTVIYTYTQNESNYWSDY